jgi:glycosyltransferase involved in cell wall biosynthesis
MARIAFFAFRGTFDHGHIGGVESIIRRLTTSLTRMGNEVSLILYGCTESKEIEIGPGAVQRQFASLNEAMNAIKTGYDHVVSVYLRPLDRFRYAVFRRRHSDSVLFHHLYCVWHESRPRRELVFAAPRLVPFNGVIFCVSPRIHRRVSRWAKRSVLLLPPVPWEYFCRPEDKPRGDRLRVTYAGRLDPAKGVDEAVSILRHMSRTKNVEPHLLGYAWSHDRETLKVQQLLKDDSDIIVDLADHQNWSAEVEKRFHESLRRTDILLMPYRRLSSTVDTPVLLLEGMANLCVVLTPALGDLHDIYGSSRFGLHGQWSVDQVTQVIEHAEPCLEEERRRLAQRNVALQFSSENIVEIFQNAINAES